jgi:hypothetical protein
MYNGMHHAAEFAVHNFLLLPKHRAPHLSAAEHDPDPTRLSELQHPDEFWAAFERRYGLSGGLQHPAMRALMLPVMRADFTMIETYKVGGNCCCSAGQPPQQPNQLNQLRHSCIGAQAAHIVTPLQTWHPPIHARASRLHILPR